MQGLVNHTQADKIESKYILLVTYSKLRQYFLLSLWKRIRLAKCILKHLLPFSNYKFTLFDK